MWTLFASAVLAAEPPVDGWIEVFPVEEARGGVLDGDEVFLRTGEGCVAASVASGPQGRRFELPLCRVELADGGELECHREVSPGPRWWDPGTMCSWTGPRAGRTGWIFGPEGHAVQPTLVEATEDHAIWRAVFPFSARPQRVRVVEERCTARSLRRMGASAPVSGVRRCDASTGIAFVPRPVGHGGAAQLEEGRRAVDCAMRCPPNPDPEAVRLENERLAGRWFAPTEGVIHGLYRTRELCEADRSDPIWMDEQACAGLGPRPWEVADEP